VAARVIPAIGDPTRAGLGVGPWHRDLLDCTARWWYHTRAPPNSGQNRRETHECYRKVGSEDRDAHGVEPEPPEQELAAAKRENRYRELT